MARLTSLLLAIVFALATPTARAQTASFQGLGNLPGGISSNASGVSADGTVVVGSS